MINTIVKKIRNGDKWIYAAVFFLLVFGSLMVGSAAIGNSAVVTATGGHAGGTEAIKTIIKQVGFVGIGLFCFVAAVSVYRNEMINRRSWLFFYIIGIGLLLACLIFTPVNGAQAWIHIGSFFTFQPSELCKVILIVILAFLFTEYPKHTLPKKKAFYKQNYRHPKKVYQKRVRRYYGYAIALPAAIILIELFIVIVLQNDTGTALITLLICAACFFVTENKYYGKVHKIILLSIVIIAILAVVFGIFYMILSYAGFITYLSEKTNFNFNILQVYQMKRFASWLNPLGDVYNTSAQLVNALIAITKGGIKGAGLFSSTQKFGYIPEVETDFITSLVFEELGLIGLACIIIPYSIIIFRLLYFGITFKNPRSRIILIGISSLFFVHLFVNLGGVSGLIPMTGIPLIFISQGGTSVMVGSIAIGISQAIIGSEKRKLKANG